MAMIIISRLLVLTIRAMPSALVRSSVKNSGALRSRSASNMSHMPMMAARKTIRNMRKKLLRPSTSNMPGTVDPSACVTPKIS